MAREWPARTRLKLPGPADRFVQRPLDVRQQVLRVLRADREADEALRHGVAAPTAPALGGGTYPAETRRVVDQPQRGEEALRRLPVGQLERHHRTEAPHLAHGDPVRRVGGQSGIPQPGDLVPPGQHLGEGQSRGALPVDAQLERRERTVGEPGLHRARDGPDDLAPAPYVGGQQGITAGDMAQQDVAVPGHALGVAGHREVRAELQRALADRGGQGVVDGDQRTCLVRHRHQPTDVADVQPRVGRALDPQQLRPLKECQLGIAAGRRGPDLDAEGRQLLPYERQRLVAVVRQHHGVARADLGEQYGGDRRHTGGEHCCAHLLAGRLQLADGPLQMGPGRVGVPAVGVGTHRLAGEVEVRGEDRTGQGRLVLLRFGKPGAYRARSVAHGAHAAP